MYFLPPSIFTPLNGAALPIRKWISRAGALSESGRHAASTFLFILLHWLFVENLLLLSLLKDANEAQSNLLDFFLLLKLKRIPFNSIKLPAQKNEGEEELEIIHQRTGSSQQQRHPALLLAKCRLIDLPVSLVPSQHGNAVKSIFLKIIPDASISLRPFTWHFQKPQIWN